MAEFITKCPHCNNNLQVQDEWDGIEVECPICSKTFTVRKPSPKLVKNSCRFRIQAFKLILSLLEYMILVSGMILKKIIYTAATVL